jgi:hypothetical protein
MQEGNPSDSEFEKRSEDSERRLYSLLNATLQGQKFSARIEHLKMRGFEFCFSDGNSESEWKQLDV